MVASPRHIVNSKKGVIRVGRRQQAELPVYNDTYECGAGADSAQLIWAPLPVPASTAVSRKQPREHAQYLRVWGAVDQAALRQLFEAGGSVETANARMRKLQGVPLGDNQARAAEIASALVVHRKSRAHVSHGTRVLRGR
jgi:hypothetical protein